jgi:hypothetical protein
MFTGTLECAYCSVFFVIKCEVFVVVTRYIFETGNNNMYELFFFK